MTDDAPATVFLLYRRFRSGSGRTWKKYRAASAGRPPTEQLRLAWTTDNRVYAMKLAKDMDYEVEEREVVAPVAKFGEPQTAKLGRIKR